MCCQAARPPYPPRRVVSSIPIHKSLDEWILDFVVVAAACVRALWRESESDDFCSFPPRRYGNHSNKKFTHCVIQTLNGDSTRLKSSSRVDRSLSRRFQ